MVDLVQGRRCNLSSQPQYTQAEFQSYRLRLENDKDVKFESDDVEALPMSKLWQSAMIPWCRWARPKRIFGPLVMVIALMLTVALSEVQSTAGTLLP